MKKKIIIAISIICIIAITITSIYLINAGNKSNEQEQKITDVKKKESKSKTQKETAGNSSNSKNQSRKLTVKEELNNIRNGTQKTKISAAAQKQIDGDINWSLSELKLEKNLENKVKLAIKDKFADFYKITHVDVYEKVSDSNNIVVCKIRTLFTYYFQVDTFTINKITKDIKIELYKDQWDFQQNPDGEISTDDLPDGDEVDENGNLI